MSDNQRDRFQLGIPLGEGPEGARLRDAIDRAAAAAGRPVTVWAREKLLAAAGDPLGQLPVDPVIEVLIRKGPGREYMDLDLRHVAAMQGGHATDVQALLVGGHWFTLVTNDPKGLVDRWKRVQRWGMGL